MQSFKTIKEFNDFEIRCLTSDFSNYQIHDQDNSELSDKLLSQAINHIVACIVKGDYKSVLQVNLENYGFPSFKFDCNNLEGVTYNFIGDGNDFHKHTKEFILIFIGISALQEFIRLNFSGPRGSIARYKVISDHLQYISESDMSNLLNLNDESICSNAVHPKLLFFSYLLLSNLKCPVSLTQKWWLLRCTFLYQSVLTQRSEMLHKTCVSLINDIQQMEWIYKDENIFQKFIFNIECCHIYLHYGTVDNAQKLLEEVQNIIGFEVELDAAMGKRKKDQKVLYPQLFVKCKRKENRFNFSSVVENENGSFPWDFPLKDDDLLNKVEFMDSNIDTLESLCVEEQVVLLAHCCLVKKREFFGELSKEEVMPYVTLLLSQPQVWSIYLKALIMRCEMEKDRSRYVERAVFQMETIIKSIKNPNPLLREREKFFFCTSFPPYWKMEKDLADSLLSIGCVETAEGVYEGLQLWEEVVKCCTYLGKTRKAEEIIRDRLSKEESSMWWCLLGDVTDDVDCYLKAWELSNERDDRAQRSLGHYYYKRKQYKESLPHFTLSLDLNQLQPQVWFMMGYAATQTKCFESAIRAYRQVITFDDDNFEAWNNLANAYVETKQYVQAWRSLQEAIKCNYDEWRAWQNFLWISTLIGAFEDSLLAWKRLLDLKDKYCDVELLEKLIKAIVTDLPDFNGYPSSRLKQRTLEVLKNITEKTCDEPRVWELYSLLIIFNADEKTLKHTLKISVDLQKKAVNCYNQKLSWEKNFKLSKNVLTASLKLTELYLAFIRLLDDKDKNEQRTSARLSLQSVLTRAESSDHNFSDEEQEELGKILDSVQESLNEILSV